MLAALLPTVELGSLKCSFKAWLLFFFLFYFCWSHTPLLPKGLLGTDTLLIWVAKPFQVNCVQSFLFNFWTNLADWLTMNFHLLLKTRTQKQTAIAKIKKQKHNNLLLPRSCYATGTPSLLLLLLFLFWTISSALLFELFQEYSFSDHNQIKVVPFALTSASDNHKKTVCWCFIELRKARNFSLKRCRC